MHDQTRRCGMAKEVGENAQHANPQLRSCQELSKEFVAEPSDVRQRRYDSDDIRSMRLCLFAVVARFFGPTDVVVAVRQGQELEHDQRMGLGHADLNNTRNPSREFAGDSMQMALGGCDRPSRTGACTPSWISTRKSFSRLYSSGAINSMRIFSALPGIAFA